MMIPFTGMPNMVKISRVEVNFEQIFPVEQLKIAKKILN